ncbi:hypothetical protein [Thalassobaculum sp.]|uniref:phage head spike fiber domain-containing protein n=1 Tax=Thalassobaculum sp. TaxID=2022740 RepID=UPI0032EFCC2A
MTLVYPSDVYLLTLQPFYRAAGERVTLYIADADYRNLPTDNEPNLYFVNALESLRFERNAYRPGNVGGASLPARFSATINAAALGDDFAVWLGYAWGGHPYRLELVRSGSAYAEREVVARGTMAALEQTDLATLTLAGHDPGEDLAGPLQARLYSGAGGFDGTVELQGAPRPVVVGDVANVEGVVVDPVNLWVDWHDGRLTSISEVRDNGVPLTETGSYPPAAGYVWHDLDRGRSRLGSSPVGAVTADVVGAAGYDNLLLNSEDFTAWTASTSGGVSLAVDADAAAAPDGSGSADTLTATGGVAGTADVSQGATVADTVHALSVHATAAAGDWLLLQADRNGSSAGGRWGAYFNLATGEVGTLVEANGASNVQAYMLPDRQGGYRCVVSGDMPSGMTSLTCRVAIAGADLGETFTAAGQSVAVWGAMLNRGPVAEPYIATAGSTVSVAAPSTLAGVCRYLLGRFAGELYPSAFDTASLAALDTDRPGVVGRAIGATGVDLSAVLDELVGGQGCFRWYTRARQFAVKAFAPATATSSTDAAVAAVVTAYDVRRGSVRRVVPGIQPWRIVARYRVLGVSQPADQLAAGVTAANRLKWSTPSVGSPPLDNRAVLRAYPRSAPLEVATYLRDEADAEDIAAALAASLDGLVLYRFEGLVELGLLELGVEVWFEHADYGHAAGVAGVLVGSVEQRRGFMQLEIAVNE